jgi:hypothetical protein
MARVIVRRSCHCRNEEAARSQPTRAVPRLLSYIIGRVNVRQRVFSRTSAAPSPVTSRLIIQRFCEESISSLVTGVGNNMKRILRVKNRLRGKSESHGASGGGSGVSSPSATPAPVPVSPGPARTFASEIPSVPTILADVPPERIVQPAPQLSKPTPASPATPLSAPPTASDATASPRHDADAWAQAYEILKEREPELTADYAKHLASVRGDPPASIHLSVPRSVESIVKQLLEDREKKQWRVSLLGRDIKIREQAEKLAKFLLWSDPIVKDALSAQPYAALAWSGVSLLLPVGI